jgi:cobalt-precorrin 5A hydrolase
MIVAGLGFRRGTSCREIEAAVDLALLRLGLAREKLDALATLSGKTGEPGVQEVSRRLALPLIACTPEALREIEDRIVTVSARAEAAVGVPSVAEASALVAAGASSALRLPRVATASATCAIAEGNGPEGNGS